MAWAPQYASTAELRAYLRIPAGDTGDDTNIALAAVAASRTVDHHTNRQFGLVDPAAERIYTWMCDRYAGRPLLLIDDVQTTASLAVLVDRDNDGTAEDTLTIGDDFELWPANAAADGKPWTGLWLKSGVTFPSYLDAVSVTAKWGWTAVPDTVKAATLVQAARYFTRQQAPFGVAGSPELGSELRLLQKVDVDVAVMLRSYVRNWGVA